MTRLTQFGVRVAPQAELERLLSGQSAPVKARGVLEAPSAVSESPSAETESFGGVLTAEEARRLAKTGTLRLGRGAILTPLARDVLREKRVALVYEEEPLC